MRRRAFSLIEVLIVVLVVSFGFLALMTVYMSNVRHSTQSRGRMLAILVVESLLNEIKDHPYGTPPPEEWGDRDTGKPAVEVFQVIVQGRPVLTSFDKRIRIAPEGNGSFFDPSKKQGLDTVEVTVRWREGTADASAEAPKEIQFTMDVKRENDLVVPVD